jgi:hypothetical protein
MSFLSAVPEILFFSLCFSAGDFFIFSRGGRSPEQIPEP